MLHLAHCSCYCQMFAPQSKSMILKHDMIFVCAGFVLKSVTSDVQNLILITDGSLLQSVANVAPRIWDLADTKHIP